MNEIPIRQILENLGQTGKMGRNGQEMNLLCPFHDDHSPSLYINLTSGRWQCFACKAKGGLVDFTRRLQLDIAPTTPTMPPLAGAATPVLKSFLDRGFTREMLSRWGIVWDADQEAMSIPVEDDNNSFLWNIWRAPEGRSPKYLYPRGVQISSILFGFYRALLKSPRRLILVEGPLDAIWLQEAGSPGVAVFGSSLSARQIELLHTYAISEVVLCFDNDQPGRLATEQVTRQLRQKGFWVFRTSLPSRYKDIQEVPLREVPKILSQAELCVNGTGFIHPRLQRWVRRREEGNGATSNVHSKLRRSQCRWS